MWMGIDQGTTGTTCIAYDDKLRPVAEAYRELATRYPRPGWVEQEPEDIVRSVVEAVGAVLAAIGGPRRVDVVGLSNQGESVVAWDAGTGRALGPALVWSDRRGAETVARLERAGQAGRVQRETGLRLDAYFSAAKLAWLLEHDHAVREAAATGTLRLGTLDTWLAWRLGGGRMLTDHSTASRTQLLGLRSGAWEPELLDLFGVPPAALAKVRPSVEPRGAFAHPSWGGELPWTASLVDQPAALADHACFDRGDVKATYGTGCFVLVNAGSEPPAPPAGLLTSIAWSHDRQRVYAFDGGVFTAGTAITWLRSIGLIAGAEETAPLAASVADTGGVLCRLLWSPVRYPGRAPHGYFSRFSSAAPGDCPHDDARRQSSQRGLGHRHHLRTHFRAHYAEFSSSGVRGTVRRGCARGWRRARTHDVASCHAEQRVGNHHSSVAGDLRCDLD